MKTIRSGTCSPSRKTPVHLPPKEGFNRPTIIFVTVCTEKRQPILCSSEVHSVLLDAWRIANVWIVGRYVIMPDHIHLFCAPATVDFAPLAKWIHYWKSLSSRSWPHRNEQPVWQKSFWDTQLRRGTSYDEKWEYVRQNPVRKNLVQAAQAWPYQGEMNKLDWLG